MIWCGWKQICQALGASPEAIRDAKRERKLPLHYPFGRPQIIVSEYCNWLTNQPPDDIPIPNFRKHP